MKAFWIKVINLTVICLILFAYQSAAHSNAGMKAMINELEEKLRQQTEEQEKQEKEESARYKDGVYEGVGNGYKGDIRVEVTVENGEIATIEITETSDDPVYQKRAASLTEEIVMSQTTEGVDTVTGATFSSAGILEAVDDALKEAAS